MSAIISTCGHYRYRLERDVGMVGTVIAFFGVNPSTAEARLDDPTVRKWIGFAKLLVARRFIVGNAFALRTTNVKALASAADPVGPENDQHLQEIIDEAELLVPCWGASAKLPAALRPRLPALLERLLDSGKPVRCFGLTAAGDPLHPLFLPYDTPLVDLEHVHG